MVQIEFVGDETPSEDEKRGREQTLQVILEELEELKDSNCECGAKAATVEVDARHAPLGYQFQIDRYCCGDFRSKLERVLFWKPLEGLLHLGVERQALTMADGYLE